MTTRFNAIDKERDRETLHATSTLRKDMEQVEFNFFARGIGTWDDVVTARDTYWEAWENRRNFVLSEKHGYENLDRTIEEYEENRA
jgi:hypothetical protein